MLARRRQRRRARLRILQVAPTQTAHIESAVDQPECLEPAVQVRVDAIVWLPHEIVAGVQDTDLLVVARGGARAQGGIGCVTVRRCAG